VLYKEFSHTAELENVWKNKEIIAEDIFQNPSVITNYIYKIKSLEENNTI
jgi:hypothetical protein